MLTIRFRFSRVIFGGSKYFILATGTSIFPDKPVQSFFLVPWGFLSMNSRSVLFPTISLTPPPRFCEDSGLWWYRLSIMTGFPSIQWEWSASFIILKPLINTKKGHIVLHHRSSNCHQLHQTFAVWGLRAVSLHWVLKRPGYCSERILWMQLSSFFLFCFVCLLFWISQGVCPGHIQSGEAYTEEPL